MIHLTRPHNDPDQLRVVRPGRQGPVAADPGPGKDHHGAGRHPERDREAVPARRAAAFRQVERGPGRRLLERPAAHGRVTEVRAGHCLLDRRQVVGVLPAEHPGGRVEGVGNAAPYDPRRQVPVRPGLPPQDCPPVEQGREPARATPRPALRPAGHHRQAAPDRPDRTGLVPDCADQRRHHLDDGVLPASRPGPAGQGPGRARRAPGPHLPGTLGERQLLRRHHRRCRGRTRQTRHRRLAPSTPHRGSGL